MTGHRRGSSSETNGRRAEIPRKQSLLSLNLISSFAPSADESGVEESWFKKKKEEGGLNNNFNAESQRPLMGPLPLLLSTTSPAFEYKFDSRGGVVRGTRKNEEGVVALSRFLWLKP